MKINKLKAISTSACCLVAALWSDSQGTEGQRISLENDQYSLKYSEFLAEYNHIGEDHQCSLKNLVALHNASSKIGDEAARAIAIGIKYNTVLNYVDLNHNNITAEGIKYLALSLTGKDIIQFHMYGSKIGDEGHKELAKAIKTWTNISHLNLNVTDLGDEGAEALADALRGKNKLVFLDFNLENKFSSKASEKLFKALANIT
jgi:hypothetical protein